MSHNLNLAQDHAWHLAQTLMVTTGSFCGFLGRGSSSAKVHSRLRVIL